MAVPVSMDAQIMQYQQNTNMAVFSKIEFILYVSEQERSKAFFRALLQSDPVLDVIGMTEFALMDNCKLGLMPNKGIARIIGDLLPHPDNGTGIPRCELYLSVDDVSKAIDRAMNCGAKMVSPVADRDQGDRVGYVADPDRHVIALAHRILTP
jgi:lactoylglutathione lyase